MFLMRKFLLSKLREIRLNKINGLLIAKQTQRFAKQTQNLLSKLRQKKYKYECFSTWKYFFQEKIMNSS